jgi:beta-N-acetylhexosaminidase
MLIRKKETRMNPNAPTPLILGCSGTTLLPEEKAYMQATPPAGFLLFSRNIESPEQTRELCAELTELSPFATPYIAVDQEGGRVQRVTFKGRAPSAHIFGEWYEYDAPAALQACELNAMLLAAQLRDVGATWLMGPCLDLRLPETHSVIGNRAFSANPNVVAELGAAFTRGVTRGGCFTCMKHAPGHGRARVDSHTELPVVDASLETLHDDFHPFAMLAENSPFMMTAHIRYTALDAANPATTSMKVLGTICYDWGFKGLTMADDVGMQALSGTYVERIWNALNAGCNLVITSMSLLKEGMAGTVFDAPHFAELKDAFLPPLSDESVAFMAKRKLPPAPNADEVASATHKLRKLWADGPSHMGYSLEL